MAERKGPGEGDNERDVVESGQQEDRSHVADERAESTAGRNAGGETELNESATADDNVGDTAAQDSPTNVVPFTGRTEDEDPVADDAAADDIEDDLVDLDESEPVDLSELQSDDALLDALGGADPAIPDQAGEETPGLEALLVSWRREVDAAPIGDLVDIDSAVAAIAAGRQPRRKLRRWHLVPVASAAAVLMITFTGVGLAARDALPGDMLWGVAQVLYSDHARAAQAWEDANHDLESAKMAWNQGNEDQAVEWLDSAHQHMQDVDAEHGLSELKAAHESLAAEFGENVGPPESSSSVASSEVPSSSFPPPTSSSEPGTSETDTSVPTTSPEPTDSSSLPSETSDSSNSPSSGTSMQDSGSGVPWFPPR